MPLSNSATLPTLSRSAHMACRVPSGVSIVTGLLPGAAPEAGPTTKDGAARPPALRPVLQAAHVTLPAAVLAAPDAEGISACGSFALSARKPAMPCDGQRAGFGSGSVDACDLAGG
mmetsp:Transcript_37352/g.118906  ORF Transcript_37352/g.118906 Transcript_37352/m.118906 type:complete len:116 (+) Transcript_37352:747-1094(+)